MGSGTGLVRHRWGGLVRVVVLFVAASASVGFGASVVTGRLVALFGWGCSFECRGAGIEYRGAERVKFFDSCEVHRYGKRIYRFNPAARFEVGDHVESEAALPGHSAFCAGLNEDPNLGRSLRLEFSGAKLLRLDTIPAAQRDERCSAKPSGE